MSRRRFLTGMAAAGFVVVFLGFHGSVSGAGFTATASGTMEATFLVPTPEPTTPTPTPDPSAPFDWNWSNYSPTCRGVTISFPSNLPSYLSGVMEVRVMDGPLTGMLYKLEGDAYQAKYPNGHAGQTVFVPWSDFRNNHIPATGSWTLTHLGVHGTNYEWRGSLTCGSSSLMSTTASNPEGSSSEATP